MMINKQQIQQTLIQIDKLYQKHMADKEGLYYSKLAILEACGWIEESMDDIVLQCANKHLKDSSNVEQVKEEVVGSTFSFGYHKNFRQMLIQVLGIINLERLENSIDSVRFDLMKSSLGTLKTYRDTYAHTYIKKGITTTVYAPSSTNKHFKYVYEGLKDVESYIRKLKLFY